MGKGEFSRGPHSSLKVRKTCPRQSDYYVCDEFEKLQAELDKAKEHSNKIICAFCGKVMQKPDDAEKVYDIMIEHMTSCDKHPIAKLASELDKYRWIPVEERLPEKTKEDLRPKHLICNEDGIAVQEWRHYDSGWDFDNYTGEPTHWMESIILP